MSKRAVYVVAVSEKEADSLVAEGLGFDTKMEAQAVIDDIHLTADPFYARQYRIYKRTDPFTEAST